MNATLRLGVNTLFYLPGEVGGSETYLLETLRALTRLPDAPSLVLFSNHENDGKLRAEFPKAEVIESGIGATSRVVRILAEQLQLPRLVKRARVEVLWSPGYTAPAVACCPQVVSILDMQYKRFPQDVSWMAARTMDLLFPVVARRANAVITISEFAKSEVVRFLRIPEEKITVTLLAADLAFGEPAGPPPESVQGAPYLLCVAHTYPHKNVARLVRAFNRLAESIPHQLVLVGKARFGEQDVLDALTASPPNRVIRFPGLHWKELISLYQGADWFVFPSLYEGFGLPVLEAMCAGTPVLTTREASLPEIGGETVRVVDARDVDKLAAALQAAIELPQQEKERLVKAARERAAGFTWETSARQLMDVFKQNLK